jgi:glycosyltransferase involved in cell wall biosynthesis
MKTLAKVILLSKDAYDTIESFIQFYGYLFDYENIVIIDNGSSDPRVLSVYERYKAKGIQVIVDKSNFMDAYLFMTNYMLDLKDTCEFILPMETDEFLFFIPKSNDMSYAISREDVHTYLQSIPKDVSIVRYGAFYASSVRTDDPNYIHHMFANPPLQMKKFYNQGWDKILVRADAFMKVAQWLHHVDVSYGKKITSDTLGLLHFHETGKRRDWERSVALVCHGGCRYIDPRLPEFMQLLIARFYRDMHVPVYHRLDKFYQILRRKVVSEMFEILVGRLPSVQELNRILQQPVYVEETIESIIHNLHNYKITEVRPLTLEDLIFWEVTQAYTYEIRHVANRLQSLSESHFANTV